MRLVTIWTVPTMSTMQRIRHTKEWTLEELARKLPKRLKYLATMQELSKVTKDTSNPNSIPLDIVIRKLDK